MSIQLKIDDSLTTQQRTTILKKLTFQQFDKRTKRSTVISPYYIDEKGDYLYIPFAFGVKNGYSVPPRENYSVSSVEFVGKLRDYQKNTKKEAIKQLNAKGSVVLSLYCGFGKTFLAIYIACKLRMKTVILINRIVLGNQWIDELKTCCPDSKVQFLKTTSTLKEDADFYVINAMNVPKLHQKHPEFFKTIATVVCDELHLICAKNMYQAMFHLCPRYIIGLSATPYRTDNLDPIIDFYFGKEKIVEKLNRKHIVYCVQTGLELDFKRQEDGSLDWNSVLESQSTHEDRNQMIVDIVRKCVSRNFLILVKRVTQGNILKRLLVESGETVATLLGSSTTFDKEARVLIGTSSKIGVGFSHVSLDALIMACDLEAYFIQYLGRVFRKQGKDHLPLVFDLVDKEPPTLKRHYSTRKKVYLSVGGTIRVVNRIDEIET